MPALPPGPSAPSVFQTLGWWNRPLAYLEQNRARFGKRFTIRLLGIPPFVMHSDPAHIKELFTAPPDVLHPGEGARILEPVVGSNSVILLDESAHLSQRKLMLPAFHGEKMEKLSDLVAEVAEREVEAWPVDTPIALHARLQGLTLEVILRAVFGLDPGERLEALRTRLTAILEIGSKPAGLIPQLQRAPLGFGPWATFDRLSEETDRLIHDLIEERRADAEERDDVLSMLLEARHEDGAPMSGIELRDELMTLLVAGHETTASALAWAFERIARTPSVAGALAAESRAGDGDAYVTATIQESLRRRPVLPNVAPRLVKKPVTLGGWDYEPGVSLVGNAYLVHHDPEIYPDPYEFRPERFLDEAPGTYTWIPFGGGRRRCLGASFALLEMKLVLRAVYARGGVRPAEAGMETPRRRSITISPRRGASVVVTRTVGQMTENEQVALTAG
ncbi:MAG TPA: cytochrome P450 [Thermoleophilaceae bacterium]|nr:cytochrome P450 [Thermoleophilaceae bacterium]